ncbi:MFS transporter [Kitasatospora kifunensis]|uniref:EmrB/QacA subfamily drug resistance transporter n=1 Tax=Kitasatospora kifunensis TaxID=58351 RepID=A0A7W7R3Q7_KITKI|nr:MFS transporter [Kitasatospora kifunensis]MBB4924907.1 EmrB/QacA subfamily drug resistance transporter [Kitasatospora kifunensis]
MSTTPGSSLADPATAGPAGTAERSPWPALLVILFAAFMDMLDLNIAAVATPAIQRSLHAGYAAGQWFVASYALSFAVFLIPGGRLGDMYGRKRVFMTGVAGFTLASAACALAPTAGVLIAARLLQGGFGALMVPQVLAVLQLLFAPNRRGAAFAAYGSVMNLAQLAGPVLGGFLATDNLLGLGWRAVFLINVPIGVLVLIGTSLLLPESRSDRPLRPDPVGILLVALLAALVVYPLQQGRAAGWPTWMLLALVGALPVAALIAWHQHRSGPERALIPVALFRTRSFTAGMVQLLLVYSALLSLQMPVIWETQIGLGWSALRTGCAMVGWVLGTCLFGVPAVALAPRIGRALLACGCVVVAAATLLLSEVAGRSELGFWPLFGCLTAIGCGLGLIAPILINLVLGGVPRRDAGSGAGLANAAVYLASAAGIGLIGLVFFARLGTGGAANARAQEPALRAVLTAQGASVATTDAAVADLRDCVVARTKALDPYQSPAHCPGGAAGNAVQAAMRAGFADSTSHSLRYPAGAFLLVLLLTPLLPRPGAEGGQADRESADRGDPVAAGSPRG